MAQQRTADAHVGGNRATQVPGQQDRAQDRRARHQIQRETHELDHANPEHSIGRVAERGRALNGRREHQHFDNRVESQEQRDERGEDDSRPRAISS